MTLLADLGIEPDPERPLMLVSPPDSALAEFASIKPRPAFASSISVAEPTSRILWWPDPGQLTPAALSRLRWMVENAGGQAWLILDPQEGPDPRAADNAARESGFAPGDAVALTEGELAIPLSLA